MSLAALIRPMAVSDLDRVLEIAQRLREAPQWPPAAYLAAIQPGAVPQRIGLAAEGPAGGLLGFAIARVLAGEAELETIAVAPEAQRQGVGRQLFGALLSKFSAQAVTDVILEVRPSNGAALALYRSLGFAVAGRRPRYYIDPVEDATLMNLSLRG